MQRMNSTDTQPAPATEATTPAPAGVVITVLPHPQLCPQGLQLQARKGRKLVDALLEAGIAIEHACEKVGACATCHVHLREGGQGVAPADEDEEDQLDKAWGLDAQSRLACCVKLGSSPLVVELPRYTKNHAREH